MPEMISRRQFTQAGFGLAPVALAWLLQQEQAKAAPVKPDIHRQEFTLKARKPDHEPKATA